MASNEANGGQQSTTSREQWDWRQELQFLASENDDFELEQIQTKIEDYRTMAAAFKAQAASLLTTTDIDELVEDFHETARKIDEDLKQLDLLTTDSCNEPADEIEVQTEVLINSRDEVQHYCTIDVTDDDEADISCNTSELVIISQNSNDCNLSEVNGTITIE